TLLARSRRLDPRRQHAGGRLARLCGVAGPRFRNPGRRQGARAAGAAPPPHHVAGRRDRRADHRPHRARYPRPDAGTAMIRPTGRAVFIFVAGIPLALFVVIYNPGLWALSFNYGLLLVVVAASDAWLAFPPRLLDVKVTVPDHLYIGERGASIVTIAATRWRRATSFELIAEQRGEIDPS